MSGFTALVGDAQIIARATLSDGTRLLFSGSAGQGRTWIDVVRPGQRSQLREQGAPEDPEFMAWYVANVEGVCKTTQDARLLAHAFEHLNAFWYAVELGGENGGAP